MFIGTPEIIEHEQDEHEHHEQEFEEREGERRNEEDSHQYLSSGRYTANEFRSDDEK